MTSLRCEPFPHDIDAAVRLHREALGLDLVRDERRSDAPHAALARGGVQLGLARREQVGDTGQLRPPTGVELVERPWGLVDFRVIDPAGYYWRITTTEPDA